MVQATRWLLAAVGAASLGCSPFVAMTTEPGGSCSEEDVALVLGWSLRGHAPVLADDYPSQLCDWDGAFLSPGERRRMGRHTSHFAVGRGWAKRGDTERALAAFRRDLEGATTSAARVDDHVEIAKLFSEAGDHEAALRELDACDEELDGEPSSQVEDARADVLVAADRRREAIAVLEARPRTKWWHEPDTQMRIAELWLEESEPLRARAAYEIALANYERHESHSGIHAARLGLVRVLQAERRLFEALDALDHVLEGIEDEIWWFEYPEAWLLRAEILVELDKPWSAAAYVRKAFELEHRYREPSEIDRAHHRSKLASLHLQADRPDLAYSGFEAAYRTYTRELGPLDKNTLTAAHNVGVACLDLEDPEQAIGWLRLAANGQEQAASEPGKRGFTLIQLGRAEHRTGLRLAAARSFAKALDLLGELDDPEMTDVERARIYRDAARAFLDMSMCERALETIDRANAAYSRTGEDESLVDLTGSQARLERLRRCRGSETSGE